MELTVRQTIILAILVLFLGKMLTKKINFLREYNIPEPVSGGIIASLVFLFIYLAFGVAVEFDLRARDTMLIVFFTTVGLSARFSDLISGGKPLAILLVLAVAYLFLQNFVGIGVASITGLPEAVGLVGGSVSLSGGHGTTIAWGPLFAEKFGIENAMEIGIACATFGLVLGGCIGGPLANWLITRYGLSSTESGPLTVGKAHDKVEKVDYDGMLNAFLAICLAIGGGIHLNKLFAMMEIQLPDFVPCLLAGIILTNIIPYVVPKWRWPSNTPSLALIADFCLGLFLAQSLMSLQLWSLAELAGPILLLLLAQVVVVVLFASLVIFRMMGSNYDAAVMSAGYAGLALGATPTAIANMTAVTQKFGASTRAFIVVPLVGAFFIDIANALIIQALVTWVD